LFSFNRTFVELKHGTVDEVKKGAAPFNRTFVELKPSNRGSEVSAGTSFNRTFVELKHKKFDAQKQAIDAF